MSHHWYVIANAQADAQRERTTATQQINAMQSYVIQTVEDFRQLVKHCDDTTFDWKDATKVRRYWKKSLNQLLDQFADQVGAPR